MKNKIKKYGKNYHIIKKDVSIKDKQRWKKVKYKYNNKSFGKNYYLISIFILIFSLVLFLLIILYKFRINNKIHKSINDKNYLKLRNETALLKFDGLKTTYLKSKDFIDKCLEGKLINPKQYTLTKNPKVSVIIPAYNCKNYILRAIRSIQNQQMEDFEIILVNDFSTDKTLSYITDLQKEDPRIKIINNLKNMGTLYSRSIGALSAKGKYIFTLDNDDIFVSSDVFSTIYDIAIKDNWDIIEFTGMLNYHGSKVSLGILRDIYFSNNKPRNPLYQPKLGNYPLVFTSKGKLIINDNYIWNKCIKTSVYQKTLKFFGEKRYKRFMTIHEDLIMVICLFNVAENFQYLKKYSVINFYRYGSASKYSPDFKKLNIYLCDAMVDFSRDALENKKNVYRFVIYLMNQKNFDKTLDKDNEDKKLFVSILNRIYSDKLIPEDIKNQIKDKSYNFNLFNTQIKT